MRCAWKGCQIVKDQVTLTIEGKFYCDEHVRAAYRRMRKEAGQDPDAPFFNFRKKPKERKK